MKGKPMDNVVGYKKEGKQLQKVAAAQEPAFDIVEWPGSHFTEN